MKLAWGSSGRWFESSRTDQITRGYEINRNLSFFELQFELHFDFKDQLKKPRQNYQQPSACVPWIDGHTGL